MLSRCGAASILRCDGTGRVVIERFRVLSERSGEGYRTLVNEALRTHRVIDEPPLTASALRRILRKKLVRE